MTVWLVFVGSAVVIVLAGTKLSRYGDQIAEMTGLGRLWINGDLDCRSPIGSVRSGGGESLRQQRLQYSGVLLCRSGLSRRSVAQYCEFCACADGSTALWSILMMNVGLMGIIYRAEKRFMLIEPDSLLMIVAYVLGLWLIFR